MLYNSMLVSSIHQHESATDTHMSPPSRTSFPSPIPTHSSRLSQSPWFGLPLLPSKSPPAICFTKVKVYVSMVLSQFATASPSPTVSTSLGADILILYNLYNFK